MTPEERQRLHDKVFSGEKVDKEALQQLAAEYQRESNDRYFGIAIELWLAGWTSHPVGKNSQIMSWYWRRPPRPGRTKGRLFLSTDQAFRNMRKEAGLPPPE